jgi:hypothetical protein
MLHIIVSARYQNYRNETASIQSTDAVREYGVLGVTENLLMCDSRDINEILCKRHSLIEVPHNFVISNIRLTNTT